VVLPRQCPISGARVVGLAKRLPITTSGLQLMGLKGHLTNCIGKCFLQATDSWGW